jgi:hypothetical protein
MAVQKPKPVSDHPRPPEVERTRFRQYLLQNPNYFGTLEASPFKPVKPIKANTSYEQMICVGLNPPYNRLEAIVQVKRDTGYGGDVCSPGTHEYVRFYVDLHDDGVWHDVGLSSVHVHDIPGDKPICYAVRRDFDAAVKYCTVENLVKVRAILQWDVPPPANTPGHVPVWGNVVNVQVQIHKREWLFAGDLFKEFEHIPVKIPDPIGPIVKGLDPHVKLTMMKAAPMSLAQKMEVYQGQSVPAARFAFPEAQQLLAMPNVGETVAPGESPLVKLGLPAAAIEGLIAKLFATDGDTSYEELRCVGLHPESDLIEAVLTVKKPAGYSGGLCGNGSLEYVAFWIDFGDGAGFEHIGTATVNVYDLATIPAEGLQYAVFLKTDLSKYRVPCQVGPRVVRLRAILSWATPPPPANPDWVPVWGNREECRVQIRPGALEGHIPLIETVGNISVSHIDGVTGLATGNGQLAAFSVVDSPFGGVVTITGRIGNPPNSYGGGAPSFKYRIEVFGPPPFDTWTPLTNAISVSYSEWVAGVPIQCMPGEYVCDKTLTPTDDGDGFGPGWYEYIEDLQGANQRFLVTDKLASWLTSAAMEGLWKIRITAKDPAGPVLLPGFQVVRVRIDNTAPSGPAGPAATQAQIEANPPLTITGATFNGSALPAVACGKFPVGSIVSGTYEAHDPGVTSPNEHFRAFSLSVTPAGPAHGAATAPAGKTYPIVSTNGEAGTWTLDTSGMDPCGYVIRLYAYDRTNYNSGGYALYMTYDVGFCLEPAPKK